MTVNPRVKEKKFVPRKRWERRYKRHQRGDEIKRWKKKAFFPSQETHFKGNIQMNSYFRLSQKAVFPTEISKVLVLNDNLYSLLLSVP